MEKKENGKSSGKRAVKDLSARDGQDVKGGLTSSVLKQRHDVSNAAIAKIR